MSCVMTDSRYGDYVEQLTYLLFLKMADEQTNRHSTGRAHPRQDLDWASLVALRRRRSGDPLPAHPDRTRQAEGHAGRNLPQGAEQDPGPGQAAAPDC